MTNNKGVDGIDEPFLGQMARNTQFLLFLQSLAAKINRGCIQRHYTHNHYWRINTTEIINSTELYTFV